MKKHNVLLMILFFVSNLYSQNVPTQSFESYFLFQKKYPSSLSAVDWFPDDYEVQGVANDGENWFFTIVDQDKTHGIMWKIPKEVDLDGDVLGNPGVLKINSEFISELEDFWHWGDADHIEYEGENFILVPTYGNNTPRIVACFRADNLELMNYAIFDSFISAGWCAVGVDNKIYVSEDDPSVIYAYDVNWDLLTDENANPFNLSNPEPHLLTYSSGAILTMTDMQGGEFSNSGEILYLVSGRGFCLGNGAPWTPQDGIHAIETENWTQIIQSNESSEIDEYFNYDYDPECSFCFGLGGGSHTPEGLTVWDLEDENNSNIRGGLHVLVDQYIWGSLNCDDKLDLFHYSAKIHINNNSNGGPGLLGLETNPFNTVNEAYNYYGIWDGATMVIEAGIYNDTGTYNKRLLITSEGGSAIIGQQ